MKLLILDRAPERVSLMPTESVSSSRFFSLLILSNGRTTILKLLFVNTIVGANNANITKIRMNAFMSILLIIELDMLDNGNKNYYQKPLNKLSVKKICMISAGYLKWRRRRMTKIICAILTMVIWGGTLVLSQNESRFNTEVNVLAQ